jgi:small subunit ribosomal protein S18
MMKRNIKTEAKECFFCKEKKTPDFMESELLAKFLTERGKIQSRERSGVCTLHQRKLALAVKRARYLALLPFIVRPE